MKHTKITHNYKLKKFTYKTAKNLNFYPCLDNHI